MKIFHILVFLVNKKQQNLHVPKEQNLELYSIDPEMRGKSKSIRELDIIN